MKQKRTEIVHDGSIQQDTLLEFQQWINSIIDRIPDEYKATSEITLDTKYEYHAVMKITYERDETDSEYQYRTNRQQEEAERQRKREIETLKLLKAKYEQ